jgi:hypothetical protein
MVFDLLYILHHSIPSKLIAMAVVETADDLQIVERL